MEIHGTKTLGLLFLELEQPAREIALGQVANEIEPSMNAVLLAAGDEVVARVYGVLLEKQSNGYPLDVWVAICVAGCEKEVGDIIRRGDRLELTTCEIDDLAKAVERVALVLYKYFPDVVKVTTSAAITVTQLA